MTDLTAVVLTSPLPSHPDTRIIDATIASIRARLPDIEILLVFDGIAAHDEDLADAYTEATRRTLWRCANEWERITPYVADEHLHQSGLLRWALDEIRTPTLLFVEGDCPLRPDLDIPWEGLVAAIRRGDVNLVRLHHEAGVLDAHRHLFDPEGPRDVGGVPLWRTHQFSARPHLASVAWYRLAMTNWFAPDARTMIEDRLYGVLCEALDTEGDMAWPLFRLALFAPDGDMRRTDHLDGREGRPKHEDLFRW